MRIALIGMSGTGKSYWSQLLAANGFERFGCDDHIGRRLARQLALADGSIEAIGQWMGFPYEAGFEDREAQYLSLERHVLSCFLDELDRRPDRPAASCVIDTTGSVIYLGAMLIERLRRQAIVVHLAAPKNRQALYAAYRARPRPVVWQGRFQPAPGEPRAAALARCYMDLYKDRERRYRHHAHLNIELPPPPDPAPSPEVLLRPVRHYLEENRHAAAP